MSFKILFLFTVLECTFIIPYAQEKKPDPVSFSGYLETYYQYNFNVPKSNSQPDFIYSYNRTNEFNLNLGVVKAAYAAGNIRANLALMTGTYANANLVNEPGVLKNIYEANAGVKISGRKNLWIDAGVFGSHIGFESAIGKDCWTLTRSLLADNSPYYESGVKISYTTDNTKWFLSGMMLNGWQRMQRVNGNSLPAFGTQLTFKPTSSVTLNSSTFIGSDKPDSARLMRYFHNFYGQFQVTEKLGLIVGFDIGAEQNSTHATGLNVWNSTVFIARYSLTSKISLAARGEYYYDEHNVIISNLPGFKVSGLSLNMDVVLAANAVWRIEVRDLKSENAIFQRNNRKVNDNAFVTSSIAISF